MESIMLIAIHEFHVTSSPYQQGVDNKINSKIDDGMESNFLLGTDITL